MTTVTSLSQTPLRLMRTKMPPILVVDDDTKILNLVRAYLEREGYAVITASDGRAALAAVRESHPRLVVLDVMLPELDGIAVLRTLRESSNIPVLILSARGAIADRVYGINEGADDYLAKPFSTRSTVRAKARRSTVRWMSTLAGSARSWATTQNTRATSRPCGAPATAPRPNERHRRPHRPRLRRRGRDGDRRHGHRRARVRRSGLRAAHGRARRDGGRGARDVRPDRIGRVRAGGDRRYCCQSRAGAAAGAAHRTTTGAGRTRGAARRRRRPLRACPSHRPRGDPLVGGLLQPDGRAPRGTGAVPARVHRERGARAAHSVDEPPGLPRGAARRGHAARPRHVRVPA